MQIWLIYALTAAVFVSAATLTAKKTLFKEHAMEFAAILSLFALILVTPFFFLIDYSALKITPIIILFFTSLLGASAFCLVAKSIRHMEISDSTPLLAIGPGITAILAFIFLKEALTLNQVLGIALLIIGAYSLETKSSLKLFDPIRIFKKSKYIHYIFIALLLYGITAMFDRVLLFRLDMQVEAFLAFVHLFLAFHIILMLHIFHDGFKGMKKGIKRVGWWILLVAIFTIGYRFAQAEAVKIANVGLVVAIKRMSAFFTVLIGGELFHEGHLVRKLIATAIIIGGALLIAL
jgi:transporter family protein